MVDPLKSALLTPTDNSCPPMLFTDAKLKAYAGNELDLPDAGALEVMMAAEPQLARRAVFALVERRLAEPASERISLSGPRLASIRRPSLTAGPEVFSFAGRAKLLRPKSGRTIMLLLSVNLWQSATIAAKKRNCISICSRSV